MRALRPILTVLTAIILLAGCGDDKDCGTCPPLGSVDWLSLAGVAYLNSDDLVFDCRLSRPGGVTRENIDSILVGGQKVDLQIQYLSVFPTLYGHLYYPNSSLSAGDVITTVAYLPDGNAVCAVTLFGYPEDTVEFTGWSPDPDADTVAPETEIVIEWRSVPDADGYTCRLEYTYDSSGTQMRQHDEVLTDTVFTISADENRFEGTWRILVAAYRAANTGPCGQNFCGEASVKGSIISITNQTQLYIAVDSGTPDSPQADKLSVSPRPEIDYRQLVERLLK